MRNLKKILALVLALVMSLSLMATASAADFKDASDISENYQTAVNVLEGLKVFKGYAEDNTFRPKGEITRAEVATIIYRIATGDAEDAQASIYTNMTTSFTDLDKAEWARGYVNYCHNAQIIKGESATKFNPNGKITGYATLAMILRAMGYGKNGEFEGAQWEYQTAAKAKEIGLIDNVIEAQLGSNAPRELVAEILFRALLTSEVDYTILNGYVPNGKTLGQEQFGLEKVTGIVMANQWAALDADKVMDADTTRMLVTDVQTVGATVQKGSKYTLSIATDLDDVGLSQDAYIAGKSGAKQVLTLAPTYENQVTFNEGKATTVADLAGKTLKVGADAEFYVNYDEAWNEWATSDQVIRYAVSKEDVDATKNKTGDANWYNFLYDLGDFKNDGETVATTVETRKMQVQTGISVNGDPEYQTVECYVRYIRPGNKITKVDQDIMKEIFFSADLLGTNIVNKGDLLVYGEVYVGTTSTKDYSDDMSWTAFREAYFKDTKENRRYSGCVNGESLRLIDNNNDATLDYVLKIEYTQDKVVGTYKDAPLLNSLPVAKYTDNNLYCPEELTQGMVVNYNIIDDKLTIKPAQIVTDTVATKNFKDITVTLTSGGDPYGQSAITNRTKLDDQIRLMDTQVEYNMYLDEFGFIRSYELAQGKKYALLTEMYPAGNYNGNYISNQNAIAEMKVGDADKEERYLSGNTSALFFSPFVWTFGNNGYYSPNGYSIAARPNYLQPAVAHLGVDANIDRGATGNTAALNITAWKRAVSEVALNASNTTGVFDYGAYPAGSYTAVAGYTATAPNTYHWDTNDYDHSFSFTNVAVYNYVGENAVTLNTVSKLATDTTGAQIYRLGSALNNVPIYTHGTRAELESAYLKANTNATPADATKWFDDNYTYDTAKNGTKIYPVYEKDYVWLDLTKDLNGSDLAVKSGTRHYNINTGYKAQFNTNSNSYVDATVDTEFYIVMPGDIMYKVGYSDLPSIRAEEIRAAYAVANNTSTQNDKQDYWVADVIVIECSRLTYDYDSISLMYSNNYETYGFTRIVSSLNNQWSALDTTNKAMLNVVPKATINTGLISWGNTPWADGSYGFYKLYNTEQTEADFLAATEIEKITQDYNKYGIYAGTITRIQDLQKSRYMDVDTKETGSGFDNLIDIGYGDSDNVPFYRISCAGKNTSGMYYTATELEVNAVETYSGVHTGDEIIWVYDKAQNKISFVVDVTQSTERTAASQWKTAVADADRAYTAPAWLDSHPKDLAPTGLYHDILASQGRKDSNVWTVKFVTDGILPADGQPRAAIQEYKVPVTAGGYDLDILDADFDLAGYVSPSATTDFAAVSIPTTNLTSVTDNTTKWTFKVAGDVTIKVQYTVATYTLTVDENTNVANGANNAGAPVVKVNGAEKATTAGTNAWTLTGLKKGDSVEVGFPAAADTHTYTYTTTGTTDNKTAVALPAGGVSFTVAGTGAVNVVINAAAKTQATVQIKADATYAPADVKYTFAPDSASDTALTDTPVTLDEYNKDEIFTVTATESFFVFDGALYVAQVNKDAVSGKATFTASLKDYDTKTLTFVKAITINVTNNVSGASRVTWTFENNGITGNTPIVTGVTDACVIPANTKMTFAATPTTEAVMVFSVTFTTSTGANVATSTAGVATTAIALTANDSAVLQNA